MSSSDWKLERRQRWLLRRAVQAKPGWQIKVFRRVAKCDACARTLALGVWAVSQSVLQLADRFFVESNAVQRIVNICTCSPGECQLTDVKEEPVFYTSDRHCWATLKGRNPEYMGASVY